VEEFDALRYGPAAVSVLLLLIALKVNSVVSSARRTKQKEVEEMHFQLQ